MVCGIGCDKSDSKDGPVMPRILASILSVAFGVDVEWESHGIVGSTVGDIKNVLLPKAFNKACDGEDIIDVNTQHGEAVHNDDNSGDSSSTKEHANKEHEIHNLRIKVLLN